jgi:hypothetical protein
MVYGGMSSRKLSPVSHQLHADVRLPRHDHQGWRPIAQDYRGRDQLREIVQNGGCDLPRPPVYVSLPFLSLEASPESVWDLTPG